MSEKKIERKCLTDFQKFTIMTRLQQDFGQEKVTTLTPTELSAKYEEILGLSASPHSIRKMCNDMGIVYPNRKGQKTDENLEIVRLYAKIEELENRVAELEKERVL